MRTAALFSASWPAMVLACLFSLSGCSLFSSAVKEAKQIQDPDFSLDLTMEAGYDLNPNDRNRASPLRLRLYELTAPDLFNKAGFLDLFDQDSANLQDTLVKKHRIPAQRPGQRTPLSFILDPATRFVAILAEFSRYQDADARVVAAVRPGSRNVGRLTMDGTRLFFEVSPELSITEKARQLLDVIPGLKPKKPPASAPAAKPKPKPAP